MWSRDGRELFYLSGTRLMVVDVTTEPAFSAGRPRTLFDGSLYVGSTGDQSYDVSPDGKRFIMIQDDPAEDMVLRVVTNWFEEVRRLTGEAGTP